MAADATRAHAARDQETAPSRPAWLPTPEEIDRALREGPRVSPSQTDPWQGQREAGSRWTKPQLVALALELDRARASRKPWAQAVVARLVDPEKVESFQYRRKVGMTSDYRTIYEMHECPLLATGKNGARVLIVAPGGDKLWVDAAPMPPGTVMRTVTALVALPWLVGAALLWVVL